MYKRQVKLRNAVEAAVLAVGSAIPLFYLPMAFNIRLMIVIAVSVPLGVFGVVGIGGDSLKMCIRDSFPGLRENHQSADS